MIKSTPEAIEQLKRAVLLKRLKERNAERRTGNTAPAIAKAERGASVPLSLSQQRLWFLDQLDPAASAAYHMPTGLRLSGVLNRPALQAALDRVVARHEMLRTRFVREDGEPSQQIAPADVGLPLRQVDLSGLEEGERQLRLEQICSAEVQAPFDLARGPLIRAMLVRLGEEEHVLLVTQHHIISDGWSMGIFIKDVRALYAAFSQGQPDPLPELPLQYADYAYWQRQWMQGEILNKQEDFWRASLAGAPALLELPTDRPRPAVQSYRGGSVRVELPAALTRNLRALSERHGCTLFMGLLAGWSLLLSRLSGQAEVVVGTPVANRPRSELEAMIGFFVNTIALRVAMDDEPNVAQLLERVRSIVTNGFSHQELPFERVVEALQPERSLGYSSLFQAMLSLNNAPAGDASLPGLKLAPVELTQPTAQFDLLLSLNDEGDTVSGRLFYATDLFEESTAVRMAERFQMLLAGMAADEGQAVGRLPWLAEDEHRLLTSGGAGLRAAAGEAEGGLLLHALFERHAAEQPDAEAAAYDGQRLSYGELNRRANRVAHALLALGVKPDARVAICLERSLDLVVAVLGVLKAGAGYVPLDPAYPADRLAYMLDDSAPAVLITGTARLPGCRRRPCRFLR
jgi:hypothetical protein